MAIKRAALYIRVSSDEQARHGLSLGDQRADLLEYAHRHNYAVVGVYADEGVSARKSYRSRKELQRLLRDVQAGAIDIIVMKCLDRWFRNVKDYYKVQDILDKCGVGWECSQDRYDTTTASGRLALHIRLAIAEEESDRTGERIRYVFNGKKKRRENLTGNLPLGYTTDKDKHLIPDEKADIVRFMFQSVLEGNSVYSLPKLVMAKYGINLTYARVYEMMQNRTYIGERHNIPNYCVAIIPPELFEQVQTRIKSRGHARINPQDRIYLFSGLIPCPSCSRLMSGYRGRANVHGKFTNYQYRCCNYLKSGPARSCSFSRSIMENKLENYLLDNLQGMISSHIFSIEHYRAKQDARHPKLTIDGLNAKLARLKDLYIDGLIDKDTYKEDYQKLQSQMNDAIKASNLPKVSPALQEIANEENFRSTYDTLSRDNKRAFWHTIVKTIEFDDLPENRGKGKVIEYRVTFL